MAALGDGLLAHAATGEARCALLAQLLELVTSRDELLVMSDAIMRRLNELDSDSKPLAKWNVGLIDLQVPADGIITRVNSILLQAAVPRVNTRLYVSLSGVPQEFEDAHANDVLGSIYNELWDAANACDNPMLDVIVLGSVPQYGLAGKEVALNDPALEVVLGGREGMGELSTADDIVRVNVTRKNLNFPTVDFVSLHKSVEEVLYRPDSSFDIHGTPSLPKFDYVVMGGTFDLLHGGHKKLLTQAAVITKKELVIGVTSAAMLKNKKHGELIEPVEERIERVKEFMTLIKPSLFVNCVVIDDPYGPAIVREDLEAMIVSTETMKGATMTNQLRQQKGLPLLHVVATLRSQTTSLSSSFLRTWLALHPSRASTLKMVDAIVRSTRTPRTPHPFSEEAAGALGGGDDTEAARSQDSVARL